jgi:hypothetical protein
MLRSFISRLLSTAGEKEDPLTKRTYARHEADICEAIIFGQTYPVINWGFGGFEFVADDGLFKAGQPLHVTLKFKLSKTNLEIVHRGTVIRAGARRCAVRFDPLEHGAKRGLQQVIDDRFARKHENQIR